MMRSARRNVSGATLPAIGVSRKNRKIISLFSGKEFLTASYSVTHSPILRKRHARMSTAKMPRAMDRFVWCAMCPIMGGPMKYPRNPIEPTKVSAEPAGMDFVLFALE